MSAVRVDPLGYVCINPKDTNDFRVFADLKEFLKKGEENLELVNEVPNPIRTPVDVETLPIVREDLGEKKNVKFPLELNDSEVAFSRIEDSEINSKLIIEKFRKRFSDLGLDQKCPKYTVLTKRKVLKELLSRLAYKNGQNVAPTKRDSNRYIKDYLLYNGWLTIDKISVVGPQTPTNNNNNHNYGTDVENYTIQRNDKCYKVFSIHVLTHRNTATRFVYPAEVDGFIHNKKTNELTPVEIKSKKLKPSRNNVTQYFDPNVGTDYLQARLGNVNKIIFAPYNENKDSNGVVTWVIRKFKESNISGEFPWYEDIRIEALIKLIEKNIDVKDVGIIIQITENADGKLIHMK
ncbi:unnamed protein product [Orchesella dallaii]|uniref:Uncharacterized protein n=1 Tax=Orchesella dallaii TaxID=48710 RepID=A0ABP1R4N5_9HEXA